MDWYIFINIIALIFSCLTLILSITFFIFICLHIRPLNGNIPLVLICNTFFAEITSSVAIIETCSRTLIGVLNPLISFDDVYCQIRAYLLYIFVGSVIYSFVIQAIFQLFRVVFYQQRRLQTIRVIAFATIIQWIFVCLINLIFFPLNDFVYISNDYRCIVAFDNTRGSLMVFLFSYIIPSNILFTTYFFIIRHVRQTNQGMQNRQFARKRDLIVLKRIMILFVVFQLFSTPLAVLWVIYIITGRLISLIYQIQTLNTAVTQFFMTIIIIFRTPQIREKFKWRQRRVHPVIRIRLQQHEITEKILVQRF